MQCHAFGVAAAGRGMKLLVLTSNAQRHRFVANTLASKVDAALVISECRPSDANERAEGRSPAMARHFRLRYEAELARFAGHEAFAAPVRPVLQGEVNLASTLDAVKRFGPDACAVFGASIIKEPLLSVLPSGRTLDLHLGLSPYYRGSGTNFWPFVNAELAYVGATLLHLDAGVDTGPIIAHVRPVFEPGDTAHTAGCKAIAAGASALASALHRLRLGKPLPSVPQWPVEQPRYYRSRDFTDEALAAYERNLAGGLVARYLGAAPAPVRLVDLDQPEAAAASSGRAA